MSLGLGIHPLAAQICVLRIQCGGYGTDYGIREAAYIMYDGLNQVEALEQVFRPLYEYVDGIVLPSEKQRWTNVLERFREVAWWIYPN
jgi:hypothetical protein